jgi:hypothetical protein
LSPEKVTSSNGDDCAEPIRQQQNRPQVTVSDSFFLWLFASGQARPSFDCFASIPELVFLMDRADTLLECACCITHAFISLRVPDGIYPIKASVNKSYSSDLRKILT